MIIKKEYEEMNKEELEKLKSFQEKIIENLRIDYDDEKRKLMDIEEELEKENYCNNPSCLEKDCNGECEK